VELPPELLARVRQIQIRTHREVSGALQGAYRSTFRGTGIEFEEVRPYQPGDEVRAIDWNVTARTGEAHVKSFIEERQLTLQLLVDTSASMDFGSGERTKRDAAAEVAALLSFVAIGQQDQVGLGLFADAPGLHLAPAAGQRHVLRVVREVVAARAGGTGCALGGVLDEQQRHLRRSALVFVLSDFLGQDPEEWGPPLAQLARRHDVVCMRVVDPFEERLPDAGVLPLRDVESGRVVEVDTSSSAVRSAWASAADRRRSEYDQALFRARVDGVTIRTDSNPADAVVAFFNRRARRLR
jgi:uncharacterized protein (DUF58 family)